MGAGNETGRAARTSHSLTTGSFHFKTLSCSGLSDKAGFLKLEPMERKRQNHIHELIDTEQSYMEDMSIVIDVNTFVLSSYLYQWSTEIPFATFAGVL